MWRRNNRARAIGSRDGPTRDDPTNGLHHASWHAKPVLSPKRWSWYPVKKKKKKKKKKKRILVTSCFGRVVIRNGIEGTRSGGGETLAYCAHRVVRVSYDGRWSRARKLFGFVIDAPSSGSSSSSSSSVRGVDAFLSLVSIRLIIVVCSCDYHDFFVFFFFVLRSRMQRIRHATLDSLKPNCNQRGSESLRQRNHRK